VADASAWLAGPDVPAESQINYELRITNQEFTDHIQLEETK
jgi:hypothetical protein